MKNNKSIRKLTQNASLKIVNSMYLIDVLDEILDGSGKETTVLCIVRKYLNCAFKDIEQCRKII